MKNHLKNQDIIKNQKIRKIFCAALITFFIIIFAACIILRISQKYIFFYPRNDITSHKQLQKNSDFEEVNIVNNGKNLN